MSSRPRKWTFRLRHILEVVDRIQEYIAELTYDEFAADQLTVDAVLHNFIIIGEASRHVPAVITARYPGVPWSQIRGIGKLSLKSYLAGKAGVSMMARRGTL